MEFLHALVQEPLHLPEGFIHIQIQSPYHNFNLATVQPALMFE